MSTPTIEDLVNTHTAQLLAYAKTRVRSAEDAEDLVQQTFVAAHKSLDRFEGDSTPRTWLFSILRHKIMDHYRKYYRGENEVISAEEYFTEEGSWRNDKEPRQLDSDSHLLDNPEFNEVLMQCRDHLPERQYAVIQMKYYDHLDSEHICHELDITPTNFWQLIHRAKLKLRDCLQQNWTDE